MLRPLDGTEPKREHLSLALSQSTEPEQSEHLINAWY